MKITVIHGQNHRGSTYHITKQLCEKLEGDVTEFFLPKDFGEFCLGCTNCFMESEEKCPHYEKLKPITDSMDKADVIILASPCYVMHSTGAMKSFLDHYGYRYMVHRPEEAMFSKQAVCIATAAGAGMKSTIKDMADSTFFWGCARTYKLGVAVMATSWQDVSPQIKNKIQKKTSSIAKKISLRVGKVKPTFKTKAFFFIMSLMQKNGFNPADANYWNAKGWTNGIKPWKK